MRGDLVLLGLAMPLLSTSLAHGQVSIDVSKITCDQFAQARVGSPKTTAIWLNGYYHGKIGSTTIDTEQSDAMFDKLDGSINEAFSAGRRPWTTAIDLA